MLYGILAPSPSRQVPFPRVAIPHGEGYSGDVDMRTVAASENESQEDRGRSRTGSRSAALRKLRLRSAVLERLEERTLMATLPAPLRSGVPISLSSVGNGGNSPDPQRNQAIGNETQPTIVIDPQNSQHMVSVFTRNATGVDTNF